MSCNSTSNSGVIISTGATDVQIANSSFTNITSASTYGIDNSGAQDLFSNIECTNVTNGCIFADAAFAVYGSNINSFSEARL